MSSGVSASGAAGHGWARWLAVVVAAIVAGLGAWAEWFSWVLSRQGPGGQTLGAALIAGAAAAAGYVLAVRRIRPTVLAALVIGVVGLPAASAHWIVTEYWAEYGAVRSIDIQIEAFVPSAPAETREAASNADEFVEEWCLSFAAMTRAIGNPDTAADSELSASLDAAIEAGDQAGLDKDGAMPSWPPGGRRGRPRLTRSTTCWPRSKRWSKRSVSPPTRACRRQMRPARRRSRPRGH
jgi:hypothetical protein